MRAHSCVRRKRRTETSQQLESSTRAILQYCNTYTHARACVHACISSSFFIFCIFACLRFSLGKVTAACTYIISPVFVVKYGVIYRFKFTILSTGIILPYGHIGRWQLGALFYGSFSSILRHKRKPLVQTPITLRAASSYLLNQNRVFYAKLSNCWRVIGCWWAERWRTFLQSCLAFEYTCTQYAARHSTCSVMLPD